MAQEKRKKRILFAALLCVLLPPLSAQVSVNPNDPIYRDISNWENLGIIHNVPPLRPYPLRLITSFLETVMACEYEDQAELARAYYERIFGKRADVGFEIADYNKRESASVDAQGKNGAKSKTNEWDVLLGVDVDVQPAEILSVSGDVNILVTDGLEKNALPTFERKRYDAVNDATDLKFAKAMQNTNVSAAVGNENIYIQGGMNRSSFGPFYEDSVSINPNAFHTGNLSAVLRHNNWNYTQSVFVIGATNDIGTGLSSNKFLMMHAFSWSPLKWLTATYYENVVFGGRFDPIYMLPFVPYMIAQSIGSFNDNVQMGVAFKVHPAAGFAWDTDIFIDDMSMNDFARLRFDTKFRFGAMTGFTYSPLNSAFKEISFKYTMITPYMYTHEQFVGDTGVVTGSTGGPNYQNYTNNGQGMGSNLPPNSDRVAFKFKANPFTNLKLDFGFNMIRHANINELLIQFAPEEAMKYLGLPEQIGELRTDGSVFNHPYSVGEYKYAWNHFMFMQSITRMYVWQASLDAGYTLPIQRFGQMTVNMGYTFEYTRNVGVQNNLLPAGVYTADQAGLDQAYADWKSKLHNDMNHHFRISFKYMYGL